MQVLSIAKNEWARLFLSRHGWLAIIAFGLIWALFLFFVIRPAASVLSTLDVGLVGDLLRQQFDLEALTQWQSTEMGLYWVFALYLLPLFTIMSAADQVASDKTRGTLRFLVMRASRTQIFFGRFLGQYLVQLLVVIVTLVSVLGLVAFYSPDNLTTALNDAPVIMANLALVLLSYVALMALFSVLSSSAKQAILYANVAWIVLWFFLGYVQNNFGPMPILDWVLPGMQISSLIKLHGMDTFNLAPIALIQTVVLLAFGWLAMRRCDI